jgi:hypothetical protein
MFACLLWWIFIANRQAQLEEVEQLENACPTSSNPRGSVKRVCFRLAFLIQGLKLGLGTPTKMAQH